MSTAIPPNLEVRPIQETNESPKNKTPPKVGKIPLVFSYTPSDDGTDENLLILLHGLGDTHLPFARLGKQLKLPQTATLSLRAPQQIPYLYEDAFQWYESFDPLGEVLTKPNPTLGTEVVMKTLEYLVRECSWPANRIHLFGFAQGGTIALEVALRWWKDKGKDGPALASIVTVSGPLLSFPSSTAANIPTSVLVFHRTKPSSSELPSGAMAAVRRGFEVVREAKVAGGEGMPGSREEWESVMRFWSENLHRRRVEGLYEVMSGSGQA